MEKRRLWGDLIAAFQYPKGAYEKDGEGLLQGHVVIGQFNRTANKGNSNNNDTDMENPQHKQQNTESNSHYPLLPRAPEPQQTSCRPAPPNRNPAWRHMVWNTLLCLARLGQPPSYVLSWILVKFNPVLAKPRTVAQRRCGCPVLESVQCQVGWGFEKPGLLESVPAHGRGGETRCSMWSLTTQTILWFYDSMTFISLT